MKSLLTATWLRFCNLLKFPPPSQTSLRDKAIAIAGKVTIASNRECSQISCPICLHAFRTKGGDDLRMTLALHLSLWHPEEVILQWDIMQPRKQVFVHLPSVIIGVGLAAGFRALLALSAGSQTRQLTYKLRR